MSKEKRIFTRKQGRPNKLKEAQEIALVADYYDKSENRLTIRELKAKYKISHQAVYDIVRRRTNGKAPQAATSEADTTGSEIPEPTSIANDSTSGSSAIGGSKSPAQES